MVKLGLKFFGEQYFKVKEEWTLKDEVYRSQEEYDNEYYEKWPFHLMRLRRPNGWQYTAAVELS